MQLIATLNNLERKEEILSLADGVVVYSSDFSSFNTLGLNKEEIINLIKSTNKKVIIAALLLALFIILDRLVTINLEFLAINLSLLPIMLAGMILGWKYALLIGALGDLIGAIFWPFGAYFPGFTISVRTFRVSLWIILI